MKIDQYRSLVREKIRFPGHEIANLGDSCAETCRMSIMTARHNSMADNKYRLRVYSFVSAEGRGYLRHRDLIDVPGWGFDDFANDQLLPLILRLTQMGFPCGDEFMRLKIRGTNTWVSPGVFAAARGLWGLLNILNGIQGLLFNLNWRWSDDERMKGKWWKFERTEGKVQDWLNFAVVGIFLHKKGIRPIFNQPISKIMRAVEIYYLEGDDWEPNSQWIVDEYRNALEAIGES